MAKYRTRPVEVEAIQWTGANLADVIAWANLTAVTQPGGGLMLMTAAGSRWASAGDWLVRGATAINVVKPDAFARTFESAE